MKAVLCKAWGLPETLVVEEVPKPEPKAGEVLVEIHAASVNYPDVLMIQKKYQIQPELPFIPGSEVAGTVRALGDGVSNVKVGDRVIAFVGLGGFAQFVAAKAAGLIVFGRARDGVFQEAAASDVPQALRDVAYFVSQREFRLDVSSTQLRRQILTGSSA